MQQKLFSLVFVFIASYSFAQQRTIQGTVKTADDSSLFGVSVTIKGTSRGVSTNLEGNYSIAASSGDILVFTYIGYETVEKTVESSNTINVTLVEDSEVLEQVIVVAYGTSTKESFTGSADIIDSKVIAGRTVTSALAAIEGNATGVQFTGGGGPGASPNIVIRGVGTLNGSSAPLIIVDGAEYGAPFSTLNQEDLESITVLKDAASTSLYGSRAANGVIIVTTKNGSKKGIKASFSSQVGMVSNAVGLYDRVTPGQYYESMWEALRNSSAGGGDPQFATNNIYSQLGYNPFNVPNNEIVGVDGRLNPNAEVIYNSLDWFDVLQQTGIRSNYNINVSGGGKDHSVFFSSSYLEDESYVIRSGFERLTARLNAEFNVNDRLKLGGNANIALSEARGPSSAGTGSIVNPFSFAQNMGSIYPVFVNDLNGNIVRDDAGNPVYDNGEGFPDFNIGNRPTNQGRHALQELVLNNEFDQDNTYSIRLFGEYKILDNLKLTATFGKDLRDTFESEYENPLIGDAQPTGRLSQTRGRNEFTTFSQVLNYNKKFGFHNLDVTAGHESVERIFSNLSGLATVQTATGIFEFANFSNIVNLDGATFDTALEGYFARLNYNFQDKYYLSASARRDGSSRFSRDARWGNFFSIGGSWRVDQETFMEEVKFVDALKLRSSWGQLGNDVIGGSYPSQALFQLTSNAALPAILISSFGNADLQWETQEMYDVAAEFTLFDKYLDGSIEYYNKTSDGLLYDLPIALSNGLNEIPVNLGVIQNRGWELGLTAHLFDKKDFSWDLRLQGTTLVNEILEIDNPVINGSKRWAVGRSRYDFFLLRTAGVDPANGDQLFFVYEENAEGESVPVLNTDGTQATTNNWQDTIPAYTGDSSLPDFVGSISNSFRYKGFTLDILITYGIGGKILDNGYSGLMHSGIYGRALHPDILNAWRQPGDITNVPRLENGNVNLVRTQSDRFLVDASFWTLKNVNLGYDIKNKVVENFGVDNLRVYVVGENLLINSRRQGLDPQFNIAGTPSANDFALGRVVSLGLNMSF